MTEIPDPSGTEPLIQLQDHGKVVVLQLNRPAKLNALSTALEQELLEVLRSPAVGSAAAIVFTGSARAFSAGADTSELPQMTPERIAAYYRGSGSVYDVVSRLPQPTVAAISGYCLGAGFELALACDIRIADETAQFGLPEVGLGILPSSGGLTRLVRAVGAAVTREIILFGERFPATEAYRLGLVREVVAAGEVMPVALERAGFLAAQPALAVAWTKAAIDAAAESSSASSLLIEQLAYAALNRSAEEGK
ncbi:enoyl-CoA hydratase/isomerase family protein [Arthrobacter sp. H14-L1]|uniref:enoyl-CoA hydratase/isomerase family protein n=1 Tax=Arthrobacter sp. H14-L1 TaxID=2996697 RepID=UPI0022709C9C|nr:enoyl-CoA hydratase/isomerase family protein [Arthrobacter sp. H14-L1]MCY0905872.1 enoyl-CoA hydratase/isomerase family protein [Arthrobacter sp. H14-L1]